MTRLKVAHVPSGWTDRSDSSVVRRLRRLLDGDPEAAAWLYDTFASPLYRRLRGRYGHLDGFDAQDVLQDAFLSVLKNDCKVLRDFVARSASETITHESLLRRLWDLSCGVASNRRRSLSRRPPITPVREETQVKRADQNRVLDRQVLERLAACVGRRNARLPLYLKLRYADGFKPDEISTATGWPIQETYRLKEALDRALASCAAELGIERP